jgi:energy-coupling factor transport system ATP-binding protein
MTAIQFEKVYFSYESGDEHGNDVFDTQASFALNGVDFSVEEGEFVAVLGHNGSGKSTLARLTNGLLSPKEGKITVFDLDTANDKSLFDIRRQVGIVFQNPDNQMVASIVEDDVAFGPENVGIPRKEIGERIEFALSAVGMQEFRKATPNRLSGGQKQRIAIAGVLALKPRVMILDEATAMLDPKGRKEVMDVVLRLNKEENITVILITHFPEEAMLADRAVVMSKGQIVMEGKPAEILSRGDELKKYALTAPRSVRICRTLKEGGLPIEDDTTANGIAAQMCASIPPCKMQTQGAGTDLTTGSAGEMDGVGEVVCENLSYAYNAKSPFATHALKGVDLEIHAGEFFGILGHTGSGKSTFVQHLNALIKLPAAGKKRKKNKNNELACKLIVAGYDLTNKKTDFNRLRSDVGMVFQYPEYQLFAETVFDDVAFGLKNFMPQLSQEERETAVREALETVGLSYEEIKDKSPFELSGGQKRRVAIAGVIVTKPKILVLDEPAAGLDPLGKEQVMSLLHDIHKDWCKTIIVVSHDMEEIAENCTRAVVFSGGNAVRVGTPKELFSCEDISLLGLDVPFVAKVAAELNKGGAALDFDFTADGFCNAVRDKKRGGDVNA